VVGRNEGNGLSINHLICKKDVKTERIALYMYQFLVLPASGFMGTGYKPYSCEANGGRKNACPLKKGEKEDSITINLLSIRKERR
jgi:hypothetical protein